MAAAGNNWDDRHRPGSSWHRHSLLLLLTGRTPVSGVAGKRSLRARPACYVPCPLLMSKG